MGSECDTGVDFNLQKKFEEASSYIASNAASLAQSELLTFYGLYKQSLKGPCDLPKPGLLNFKAKNKWEAWHNLGKMPRKEAMKLYIEKLSSVDPEWYAEQKHQAKNTLGPVISTFLNTEPEMEEESKTPFDWVKEGDMIKLQQFCSTNESIISCKDEQGLSLLHWACDRGHTEVVSFLVSCGINIDFQDEDGQTALHYASSCGHEELVILLLKSGASPNLADSEGLLPSEVALTPEIKKIFLR